MFLSVLLSLLSRKVFVILSYSFLGYFYIGETTRHFSKRIDEHLRTDKNSAIYKHLFTDTNCVDNSSADWFSILDIAISRYQLKIKEGMHIKWENPSLNKQVKYESTHLTLWTPPFPLLHYLFLVFTSYNRCYKKYWIFYLLTICLHYKCFYCKLIINIFIHCISIWTYVTKFHYLCLGKLA